MIDKLAEKQNWAKIAPLLGILSLAIIFYFYDFLDVMFWILINIPIYLFHQTEEHFLPGGFKKYINQKVFKMPKNEEKLTDIKVFWINILLVWVTFAIFALLSYVNMGFGLLIIIFSIINCITHIRQAIRLKEYNPGLVMATLQFLISIYASYFVTINGLENKVFWWVTGIIFSIIIHVILFKDIMDKD